MSAEIAARLAQAREHVRDELRKADSKATALLSLFGGALAGVIALSSRPLPDVAAVGLWLAAAPIAASVLVLLSVLRPRLGSHPIAGTWQHAAHAGPATLLETSAASEDNTLVALHICRLASLALAKYRRITAAITLLVIGLGLLAVALVLSVVT